MIKLLELVTELTRHDAPTITVKGRNWAVTEYACLSDAPEFTCISYAWGESRIPNPFADGQMMSTRMVRALETAIEALQSKDNWVDNIQFDHGNDPAKEDAKQVAAVTASLALWVDALSVPADEPARTVCLQNMGEIFSAAYQVMVILDEKCANVVQSVSKKEALGAAALVLLEGEDWVNRAWTYQEAVNSRYLYFVAEGRPRAFVSGHDFLNEIVVSIDAYMAANEIDKISWERDRPQLKGLEYLLADYLIADYATRSAYQVMSVMERRASERAEDHFYAMIGAITKTVERAASNEVLNPSEYLMRVCEEKGDYSFIYNTGPRETDVGRCWRPQVGRFPAVLPNLITFGGGEIGSMEPTHLNLNKMFRLVAGATGADGLKAARWFADMTDEDAPANDVAASILSRLRTLGFSGCGEYLEFETGLFFPQSMPVDVDEMVAFVSCDIHWVAGGPGLLLRSGHEDIYHFHDVGAFVGRSPKSGEVVKVQ